MHRFIPVLARLQGANITQVEVKHHPRNCGSSKYGLNRSFKVISDLMLIIFFQKYMQRPMHLLQADSLFSAQALVLDLYCWIQKIAGHDIWGRPPYYPGAATYFCGIQLITVGVMAEVNMRTYMPNRRVKKPTR